MKTRNPLVRYISLFLVSLLVVFSLQFSPAQAGELPNCPQGFSSQVFGQGKGQSKYCVNKQNTSSTQTMTDGSKLSQKATFNQKTGETNLVIQWEGKGQEVLTIQPRTGGEAISLPRFGKLNIKKHFIGFGNLTSVGYAFL